MIQIQIQTLTNSNFDEKDPQIDHSAPGDGNGEWIIFFPAEEGERVNFFAFLLRNNITPLSTAVSPGVSYARILLLFPYLLKTQENE